MQIQFTQTLLEAGAGIIFIVTPPVQHPFVTSLTQLPSTGQYTAKLFASGALALAVLSCEQFLLLWLLIALPTLTFYLYAKIQCSCWSRRAPVLCLHCSPWRLITSGPLLLLLYLEGCKFLIRARKLLVMGPV